MANISSYDSDVLSEVPFHDTNIENDMSSQSVQENQCSEQPFFDNTTEIDITSDSNIISYEQCLHETETPVVIDDRNAKVMDFEKQIHSLKLQLNATIESHKTLSTTIECLKKESKQKEDKYLDEVIDLQKKNKALDNVPTLYDGNTIVKTHVAVSVTDTEETLELAEESRLKILAKQDDPSLKKHKVNLKSVDYVALNKLCKHFAKHFVPQKQLSAEQAYWLPIS
ncbi:hypothetical protein Tco_0813200 [Tanacetum coccineum]